MNPWCCQMLETSSGGVTTATIRPCLVTDSRVNLRFASWSSRPRHLALNSDAVIVYSDAIGHSHMTGLNYMTIWVDCRAFPRHFDHADVGGSVIRPAGADRPLRPHRRSNTVQGPEPPRSRLTVPP